jgi:hypothetical protein
MCSKKNYTYERTNKRKKLLQDKPKSKSILKRLRSPTSREIGERLMMTTTMEVWTLSDGGSRLYALLHEARIRRELIL